MSNVLLFPRERIIQAAAERFANATDTNPDELLAFMGAAIPQLTPTRLYDFTRYDAHNEMQHLLLDFFDEYWRAGKNSDHSGMLKVAASYADRILDMVEK